MSKKSDHRKSSISSGHSKKKRRKEKASSPVVETQTLEEAPPSSVVENQTLVSESTIDDLGSGDLVVKGDQPDAQVEGTDLKLKDEAAGSEDEEPEVNKLDMFYQLVTCLDQSTGLLTLEEPTEDMVTVVQRLSKELQAGPTQITTYPPELIELRTRLIKLLLKSLEVVTKISPKYRSIKGWVPEDFTERFVEGAFNLEFLNSRLWMHVSQLNVQGYHSISALNDDPTVLGSIPMPKTKERVIKDAHQTFRTFYLSTITEAYGEELNKLRETEEFTQARLELLIDSVESGMALFSEADQGLLVLDHPKS